jgi:hypothetical protein
MCCLVQVLPFCLQASPTPGPQAILASSQQGDKVRITGSIVSRAGDLVRVLDKKSGELVVVNITDNTKIERKKQGFKFYRHTDMDVVPGLTIEAEGLGNKFEGAARRQQDFLHSRRIRHRSSTGATDCGQPGHRPKCSIHSRRGSSRSQPGTVFRRGGSGLGRSS